MTKKRTFAALSILTRSICTVNDNRPLNEWIFLIHFCYFPRRSIEISSFGLVCCFFYLENKKRLRLQQLLADSNSDFSSVHRLLYHAVFISHKSVCCVYYFHLVYLLYSVDIHLSISEMPNQLWHDLSLSLSKPPCYNDHAEHMKYSLRQATREKNKIHESILCIRSSLLKRNITTHLWVQ